MQIIIIKKKPKLALSDICNSSGVTMRCGRCKRSVMGNENLPSMWKIQHVESSPYSYGPLSSFVETLMLASSPTAAKS